MKCTTTHIIIIQKREGINKKLNIQPASRDMQNKI